MYVKQIENGLDLTDIAKSITTIYDTSLEPDQSIQPHYHPGFEEIYYILSGYGIMIIEDEKQEISRGDVVYIPVSATHTFLNTGTVSLRFMTVSAKRDK